ncbi:DNA polymerase ligase N-terminal domain-containing protein [Streptomyces sp. WMMB 322]|uniref:DNA polymerase ligase N-terminal domain-containing protein n=1 Tax=Streptomyces sp. WMMB 322 TaxID=1286821 RepID=UPI000823ED54|nr:DNA polymerase ligase N-terminal domain-containing protein [Streptomyces sp. WMMB 322]SCK45444.1 bifunctional non-homologous end joining protein LigD [Streptomyces sp. WMMB 322]
MSGKPRKSTKDARTRTKGSGTGKNAARGGGSTAAGKGGQAGKRGASGGPDPLRRYREKRHFATTGEPRGAGTEPSGGGGGFVVQIHDASTMHFDFRLEVEGVLKSWSVPKGPSPDPREKRLAMPTEDHPLEYRDFEGVVPTGEYGAGTVIIWDEGTYRPLSENFAEALRHGHATFWLEGRKLRGGYALTRFRGGGDEGREAWLLVKEADARAAHDGGTPDPLRARSARTRRTLKQVAAEEGTA